MTGCLAPRNLQAALERRQKRTSEEFSDPIVPRAPAGVPHVNWNVRPVDRAGNVSMTSTSSPGGSDTAIERSSHV